MASESPPPIDRPIEGPPYTAPPPAPYTYPPYSRQRPLGVTVLAILEILGGIAFLVMAIGLFVLSSAMDMQEIFDQAGQDIPPWLMETMPALFGIIGIVFLILAIVEFLIAYGFFKGKGWSWTIGVVLLIISIVFNVIGLISYGLDYGWVMNLMIGIVIPVIVLVYLFQPRVKAWFGKTS